MQTLDVSSTISPGEPGDLLREIERIDAAAAESLTLAVPQELAASLGIAVTRRGSLVAVRSAALDVLAFNRVIGFGLDEDASRLLLEKIIAEYRDAGVPRFFLQLSPLAASAEIQSWLSACGFVHYNNWMKLCRHVRDVPEAPTDLRVEKIDQEHAADFSRIVATAFGMPEIIRPWLAATIGSAGWYHYMAFEGNRPVAAGVLYVEGETGYLLLAATEQKYRGHGAQSALIARRVRDARDIGCRLLAVETAEDTPERKAPSFHNLVRLGFQPLYPRPNYIWTKSVS